MRCLLTSVVLSWILGGCGHLAGTEQAEVPPLPAYAPPEELGHPDEWVPFPTGSDWSFALSVAPGRWIGQRSLKAATREFNDDCSGLVRWAFAQLGISVMRETAPGESGVEALFRESVARGALHSGVPRPGDLVFFRDTYDRNHDGKVNDGLTHVALVDLVLPDGTVMFVHRGKKGVARGRMNRQHPDVRSDAAGQVLNDYLRPATRSSAPRLAGELFVSYASSSRLR